MTKPQVTETGPSSIPTDVDYYEVPEGGFSIYSWCPKADGSGPVTQVHLHLNASFGKVMVRFKGPDTLDGVIAALIKHRQDVWGERWTRAGRAALEERVKVLEVALREMEANCGCEDAPGGQRCSNCERGDAALKAAP